MMTRAEAQEVLDTANLIAIGVRADDVRKARHGDRVTFVRVLDVPVSGPAAKAIPREAGEIRITGRPDSLAQVESFLHSLKQSLAAGSIRATLTGFALHDLEHLGAVSHVVSRLKKLGLEMIAEAAIDRLSDPEKSIRDVNAAGLEIARLTLHGAQRDPIAALERVRDAAVASTRRIARAFAPLPRMLDPTSPTTGYDDVKLVALARLFLENVETIQVDWTLYGPKLAQVALTFGANDLDAVPLDPAAENLLGPRRAPLEEVKRNIRAASFVPVQRNGRFDPIPTPETAAGAPR